jgi:hypothetical protein
MVREVAYQYERAISYYLDLRIYNAQVINTFLLYLGIYTSRFLNKYL